MKKKKIYFINFLIIVIFVNSISNTTTYAYEEINDDTKIYTFSVKISDSYNIIQEGKNNYDVILMDQFYNIIDPGKPSLPSKKYLIALDPGAKVSSVEITGLKCIQIPGKYNIKPTSVVTPVIDPMINRDSIDNDNNEWNEKYKSIYSSDDAFPNTPGELLCKGTFHDYVYVSVVIYPFRFHPLTGRIFKYDSIEIKVEYKNEKVNEINYNKIISEKASKLFVNYDEIKELYKPTNISVSSISQTFDYIIITTSDLYHSIVSSYFLEWKSSVGFNPRIVNITDELIIEQSGHDLAEKIRTFLREYFNQWGIRYVLIVGNYDTVPMRYCFFNKNNHQSYSNLSDFWKTGEVPTDYYYADLSYPDEESWDSDGDGFYGEYGDDNVDFLAEVFVGRIPTNDPSRVRYTLEKSIVFESDTGEWKNNVLLAGAIIDFRRFKDGAHTLNFIENNVMANMPVSHHSEQEGVKASDYPWNPLTEESFINDWKTGNYGVVNWFAHGWCDSASRYIWESDDDGDGRADSNELVWRDMINIESNLDDDYPSIVFDMSCLVGYPEPCPDEWPDDWKGNLGIDLLTKPSFGSSVGILCETRFGYIGVLNFPEEQGGIESICYEFNKNLITKQESLGEAFYNAKFYCNENCPISDSREYSNMEGYNLYGDPSLVYKGIESEGRPEKPVIFGTVSGKVGKDYNYSGLSIDPDGDNIYYFFEWGDKTNSGWIGPFNSGDSCNVSHLWNERGEYEITVRVKDINGIVSEWSDPLVVSIPKNKVIHRFPLFYKFLEQHPRLFPILRLILEL